MGTGIDGPDCVLAGLVAVARTTLGEGLVGSTAGLLRPGRA